MRRNLASQLRSLAQLAGNRRHQQTECRSPFASSYEQGACLMKRRSAPGPNTIQPVPDVPVGPHRSSCRLQRQPLRASPVAASAKEGSEHVGDPKSCGELSAPTVQVGQHDLARRRRHSWDAARVVCSPPSEPRSEPGAGIDAIRPRRSLTAQDRVYSSPMQRVQVPHVTAEVA